MTYGLLNKAHVPSFSREGIPLASLDRTQCTHITTNPDRKWEREREHELVPSCSNALWDLLLLLLLLIPVHWRAPRSETEEETDRLSEGTG